MLSVGERLAELMDDHFLSYDRSPLLILDTSRVTSLEEPGSLDEAIDLIRRTRAGAQCVRLAGHQAG
jgi:hypothetical protein